MKNKISYHLFKNSIVLHRLGKTYTIGENDVRFKELKKLVEENDLSNVGIILDKESIANVEMLLGF